MKNMDKEPTLPKWVLINWLRRPQMPPKCWAQLVCLSPKVWDFRKKAFSLGVHSPWISASSGVQTFCQYWDARVLHFNQNFHEKWQIRAWCHNTVKGGQKITQNVLGEHKVVTTEQQFLGVILSFFMHLRWPWLSRFLHKCCRSNLIFLYFYDFELKWLLQHLRKKTR